MRWVAAALVLIPSVALSEGFKGVSAFAALSPNYPCDQFLSTVVVAEKPAIAVLWGTFGDDLTCLKRFTSLFADRDHLVQVHFSNETCRRKGKCYEGELLGGLGVKAYRESVLNGAALPFIRARALEIAANMRAISGPRTTLMLSTGLEDNYSTEQYQTILNELREVWPYIIVSNPVGGNPRGEFGADLLETHSKEGRARHPFCVANEDGDLEASYSRTRRFFKSYASCYAVFAWRKSHQGFTPSVPRPMSRKFRYSDSDVQRIANVLLEASDS